MNKHNWVKLSKLKIVVNQNWESHKYFKYTHYYEEVFHLNE